MFSGIRVRREKISKLWSEIQEIERFITKYEEILSKLEKGRRFKFETWFRNSDGLAENLDNIHQDTLESIRKKSKKTTPERVRDTEGFMVREKKGELVEKVEDTIDRFEKEKINKIDLVNKNKKSLKLRKYFLLLPLMTIWVFLALALYILLF